MAFEGNIYTHGITFSNLSSAYIRIVNADTSQEIARCSLGADTKIGSEMLTSRVLLFAKLFRGHDRWVLQTVSEPRSEELRKLPVGAVENDMIPLSVTTEDADDGAPTPQVMTRDAAIVTEGQVEAFDGTSSSKNGRQKKPKRSYLLPALALGTAAGVAAAVAIFGPDKLTSDEMSSGVFSDGVDWASSVAPDVPTDCGCLNDCECVGGLNVGENCGDAFDSGKDYCACGPCFEVAGFESPCAALCDNDICNMLEGTIGSCLGGFGDVCGDICDGGQDIFDGCFGADCCDAIVRCGDAGGVGDAISNCGEACGNILGGVDLDQCGGNAMGCLNGAAGCIGGVLQSIGDLDLGDD